MDDRSKRIGIVLGVGIVIGLVLGLVVSGSLAPLAAPWRQPVVATAESQTSVQQSRPLDPTVVTLDEDQTQRLKIEPVQLRIFREEKTAVGRIAFNDERTTSIFAPFQGRVLRLIAKPGDSLQSGNRLLIIESPDLVQANGDLIAASVAVRKAQNQLTMAERVATRQKLLYEAGAGAYKDFEQADSDLRNAQHDVKTSEGQLTAARNRLGAPFGKSDAEIAKIETTHEVDRVTQIVSPIAGTVTARKVSPGQFVRADNTEPMFAVADVSSMWLIANVAEMDIPLIKLGQEPDMFASFRILTGAPAQSPSVPAGAIVREGDGTMTAWVTTDRKRLVKRTVKVGLQQDGFDQILEGLQAGELVATESALFLGNLVTSAQ